MEEEGNLKEALPTLRPRYFFIPTSLSPHHLSTPGSSKGFRWTFGSGPPQWYVDPQGYANSLDAQTAHHSKKESRTRGVSALSV